MLIVCHLNAQYLDRDCLDASCCVLNAELWWSPACPAALRGIDNGTCQADRMIADCAIMLADGRMVACMQPQSVSCVMCHVLAVRVAEEAGTTLGQTDR